MLTSINYFGKRGTYGTLTLLTNINNEDMIDPSALFGNQRDTLRFLSS